MGVISDAAESPGDVMRRLANLERQVQQLHTARRLESASVGSGGIRVQGGRLLAQDATGDPVFEVTTEPAGIFMRPELISAVAVQVFAERIAGQQVLDLVQSGQTSWGDLPGSPGPEVTVEVTEAGAMIVQVSALMVNGARTAGGPGQTFAEMGFEVSGASSVAASANRALIVGGPVSSAQPDGITMGATKTVYVSGLNPGTHTVTAKYITEVFSVTAAGAFFSRRDLVVTAF